MVENGIKRYRKREIFISPFRIRYPALPLVIYVHAKQGCHRGLPQYFPKKENSINGCGMGPLLVLDSPCLKENVVVTYKIGSFLCNLDNLLQKNEIVFFFWKSNFKMASFEKRVILIYFSHFLVTREKLQKFLQHISHSHKYMYFAHPIDFFALPFFFFFKYEFIRYGFSLVWFLVLVLIRTILEQSINNKMVSKILVGMSNTDMLY